MSILEEHKNKGFTLIELLVVIAIIGILASVVLASLNSARDKGVDAALRTNLNGLRGESEIYHDNGRTYVGMCTSYQKFVDAMNASKVAVSNTPTLGGLGDGECIDSNSAWAAWVNLKTSSTTAWCVDSTGVALDIPVQNSSTINLITCP